MKRTTCFFLIYFIIVAVACNRSSEKDYRNSSGHLVVEEWYSDTKIKSRTTYLNNDKTNYIYEEFYESGKLLDSGKYINNTIAGLRKYYDQTADLMHLENYNKGMLHGIHKAVYDNGVTSYEGYRINGMKVGEWEFHYPDGRPITYEFYDSTGRLKYFKKYNDKGIASKTEGSGLIAVSKMDSLSDQMITMEIVAVTPPKYLTIVKVLTGSTSRVLSEKELQRSREIIQFPSPIENPDNITIQLEITAKLSGETEIYKQEVPNQSNN